MSDPRKQKRSDAPRRIGLVMQSLRTGGLEALVMRLAQAYQTRGDRPEVFAYEDGELHEPLRASGVMVHCLPKAPGYQPAFSLRLARLFRRRRLDLLHTHHFGPLIYTAPGAWQQGIPLVHTVHSNEHLIGDAAKARAMFAALAKSCSAITTVNQDLATFLATKVGVAPSLLHPIANGVDSQVFRGELERPSQSQRQALGIPTDAVLAGVVARLEPEKGHTYLLQALAQCKRPLHLMVVGDGSQRPALLQEARSLGLASRVHFLGNRTDIPALLSAMDLFVLPSLREGLPLAMLEAMASGLAVLGTSVGGVPTLIAQSRGGLCVPPGDAKALAEALLALVDNDEQRQEMALQGQTMVRRDYGQEKMISQYLEVYQQACSPGRIAGLKAFISTTTSALRHQVWQATQDRRHRWQGTQQASRGGQ